MAATLRRTRQEIKCESAQIDPLRRDGSCFYRILSLAAHRAKTTRVRPAALEIAEKAVLHQKVKLTLSSQTE